MFKTFRKFTYPFAAFLFVLYVLVSFNEVIVNPDDTEQGTVLSATVSIYDEPTITPEELVSEYQKIIKNVVSEFEYLVEVRKSNTKQNELLETIGNIEQKLLKQRVPGVYQDLHLEMMSVTNSLTAIHTQNSTGTDISNVVEKLESIKNQYAWF